MKIAVIGGAGLMGPTTVRDLSENPEIEEILVADYQGKKAEGLARSYKDSRIRGVFVDGYNVEETAKLIEGYDCVIQSAIYYVNIPVMQACLKAGCHYNDLGGMFYTTQKQLKLFDDFKKEGLTAVLGIGSAPGTTNILARYAYDKLDEVEKVHVSSAGIDLTDTQGIEVFKPAYSLLTIMEEFTDNAVEFINGRYEEIPALSGLEEINYPEPIGTQTCFHTLHSEPATLPSSFENKGVKEVVWKLGLPAQFFESAKFLASVGFGSTKTIKVREWEVVPREILNAVVERQVTEKLEGKNIKPNAIRARHASVTGKKNGKQMEYVLDCVSGIHSRWGVACATQVPPSIVAQMQAKGMIKEPGVWAPEQAVDSEYFFNELAKREMSVQVMVKEEIVGY